MHHLNVPNYLSTCIRLQCMHEVNTLFCGSFLCGFPYSGVWDTPNDNQKDIKLDRHDHMSTLNLAVLSSCRLLLIGSMCHL